MPVLVTPDTPPLTLPELVELMDLLDQARNTADQPVSDDARARLYALVEQPTTSTWQDAHSLCIAGWETLWQAVLAVDATFPVLGRRTDQHGDVLEDWERIPDRQLVLAALRRQLAS